MTFDI